MPNQNRPLFLISLILLLVPFVSFIKIKSHPRSAANREGFALVELFTSEGCSSCPPADEAVGRLKGWEKNVYVLSFHVDYWDNLGWKDIFSSPAYSGRQQEYGAWFHLNSIYTPQIIVNGRQEFVGSDETRLRETIRASIREVPKKEIQLHVQAANNNQIPVSYSTDPNPDLRLNLALVQNETTHFVQRGENKGRSLTHYFTVRDFKVLKTSKESNSVNLELPANLKSSDCTVVAYLQDPKNGEILAATGSTIP